MGLSKRVAFFSCFLKYPKDGSKLLCLWSRWRTLEWSKSCNKDIELMVSMGRMKLNRMELPHSLWPSLNFSLNLMKTTCCGFDCGLAGISWTLCTLFHWHHEIYVFVLSWFNAALRKLGTCTSYLQLLLVETCTPLMGALDCCHGCRAWLLPRFHREQNPKKSTTFWILPSVYS